MSEPSGLEVTLLDGRVVRYVHLDHAATSPVLPEVAAFVRDYEPWYGSVHRGTGHPAFLATWLSEKARRFVGRVLGADPGYHQVLFDANATSAINKLARILQLEKSDVILISDIEHSSNDLPWRKWATVQRYRTGPNQEIDPGSLREALGTFGSKVRLVAVTGASNVNGLVPPLHDIARICHEFGVLLFADCTQLVPHRQLNLSGDSVAERIDCMVATGHKLGAPYGTAALILPRELVEPREIPSDEPGGGTIEALAEDSVYWAAAPDRFEAGSPNLIGILAFSKALEVLAREYHNLSTREEKLWTEACESLRRIPGVQVYIDGEGQERTPIIPFNIDGLPAGLVAAALAWEHGVGIRHGRHCADLLVMRLIGISADRQHEITASATCGLGMPEEIGLARASLGFNNTGDDIIRLVQGVEDLAKRGPRFTYQKCAGMHPVSGRLSSQTGEYWPQGLDFAEIFQSFSLPSGFHFLET